MVPRRQVTLGRCQMFGDVDSDTESIPPEKEQKTTTIARHGNREAFKKGVVRPISLFPDTRDCAPSTDLSSLPGTPHMQISISMCHSAYTTPNSSCAMTKRVAGGAQGVPIKMS